MTKENTEPKAKLMFLNALQIDDRLLAAVKAR